MKLLKKVILPVLLLALLFVSQFNSPMYSLISEEKGPVGFGFTHSHHNTPNHINQNNQL